MRGKGWCRKCGRLRHVRYEQYDVQTPAGRVEVGVCLPCDTTRDIDGNYVPSKPEPTPGE